MIEIEFANALIASSSNCEEIEGQYFFPPQDVHLEHLVPTVSDQKQAWFGQAQYYDVVTSTHTYKAAAWSYPDCRVPKIRGYFTFHPGLTLKIQHPDTRELPSDRSKMTVGQCIKCGSIEHADLAMRRNFSQMVRAIWNNQVIAESATFETVEGNVYFPANSIKKEFFKPSDHQTVCGWKGTASYYTIEVNGKQNPNAAWYYATPKDAAKQITNHVAFWKGVQVEK